VKQLVVSRFFVTCDHFRCFQTVNFPWKQLDLFPGKVYCLETPGEFFFFFLQTPLFQNPVSRNFAKLGSETSNLGSFRTKFHQKNMKHESRACFRSKFQKNRVIGNRKMPVVSRIGPWFWILVSETTSCFQNRTPVLDSGL
jgi:hypothetical protein